jgi:uncharacterized protein YhaN
MKIHSINLRNVRQIKELTLDVSAPLTVIGAPNGAGKTTVQQAVLAALFSPEKKVRDSLISRFDLDTPPAVTLALSRGEAAATIILSRYLTDDKGKWREGANIIQGKGQALAEVQKVFPISADAAAVLLWGSQEDMSAVIEKFPSDGHSLLTAAAIKGSGPDPKDIVDVLTRDSDQARKGEKGGQVVGPLTQAKKRVEALTQELNEAQRLEEDVKSRRLQWEQAKMQREQLRDRAQKSETEVARLVRLEKLLGTALQDQATVNELEDKQSQWARLEEEIAAARKALAALEKDLGQLRTQHRVARDQELGRQIDSLAAKILAAKELQDACARLDKDLMSKKRPDLDDVESYRKAQRQIDQARAKMEASGVRYEVSATSGARTVRIAEDGGPPKEVVLRAGENHEGIVGRLTIEAEGLRFTAGGKEDISRHKKTLAEREKEIAALFKKFAAEDEAGFFALAEEKVKLADEQREKRNALKAQLGSSTPAGLQMDLQLVEKARADNQMSLKDREACAGKNLPPAAELHRWCDHKEGEINQAKESLATLEEKRPAETERGLHLSNLEALRRRARDSASHFKDADELHREPGKELQKPLQKLIETRTAEQKFLAGELLESERTVSGLEGQLKLIMPHRPLPQIETELAEAQQAFRHEQVLQEARGLLIERIEEKMSMLAAHVPIELGNRITEHLSKMTGGAFGQVRLDKDLGVSDVDENGRAAQSWQPHELSFGERHQAALAVKIAVARALAETTGPVFIMLDDSLVTFDPQRRAATENWLLDLVGDEKLQVILFTCHTDWAADWKKRAPEMVRYIELAREASYYREPPSVRAGKELAKV